METPPKTFPLHDPQNLGSRPPTHRNWRARILYRSFFRDYGRCSSIQYLSLGFQGIGIFLLFIQRRIPSSFGICNVLVIIFNQPQKQSHPLLIPIFVYIITLDLQRRNKCAAEDKCLKHLFLGYYLPISKRRRAGCTNCTHPLLVVRWISSCSSQLR